MQGWNKRKEQPDLTERKGDCWLVKTGRDEPWRDWLHECLAQNLNCWLSRIESLCWGNLSQRFAPGCLMSAPWKNKSCIHSTCGSLLTTSKCPLFASIIPQKKSGGLIELASKAREWDESLSFRLVKWPWAWILAQEIGRSDCLFSSNLRWGVLKESLFSHPWLNYRIWIKRCEVNLEGKWKSC